ncbi:MDR family MFS transporter [Micrococcus endophyticus]|uniref:MDR family MFS transporter n=1 Tax=Micrococcus endophyticus TaxID=455343 RepID=UPI002004AD6C|nr:MDR family MFS transporter [Micrococcus endophyticus]
MSPTSPAVAGTAPAGAPSLERAAADAARHRAVLQALTGLLLGMFVSMIANTVVSTSMPVIISDIGGNQNDYTWVITAALLATAVSTPVWGKLADLMDRKMLFQVALVIFVGASAAAGFTNDPTFLIVCRVVQGLGGGGLAALSQVIMADIISPRERGRYMGLFGAVMAVATVGGPLAGGVITDLWGWRWNFFVAVPFALVALVMVQRTLHLPAREPRKVSIDYLGIVLLGVATSLLLIWVTTAGQQFPWASWTTAWMVGGAVLAAALFVVVELKVTEPLIPLTLFRNRTFTLATIASIATGLAMFGAGVYLAQYMQLARGATPTQAGLMTIPMIAGLLITSTVIGRVITRTGVWKRWLIVGAVLLTAGMALLATLHYDTPFVLVSLHMLLLGAGVGMTMQNLVLVVQNTTDPRQMGVASSGVTFFRSLGGSVGVAAMGAVVANVVPSRFEARGADLAAALQSLGADGPVWAQRLQSGTLPRVAEMPEPLRVVVEDVYATGISQAFLVGVPLAVVAVVAIVFLPNIPLGRMTTSERLDASRADLATVTAPAAMQKVPATGEIPVVAPAAGGAGGTDDACTAEDADGTEGVPAAQGPTTAPAEPTAERAERPAVQPAAESVPARVVAPAAAAPSTAAASGRSGGPRPGARVAAGAAAAAALLTAIAPLVRQARRG